MFSKVLAKDLIVKWNYMFPADRWWREKHNIAFFSKDHLEQSQLNIALEYFEEKLFLDLEEKRKQESEKIERYNKGELLSIDSNLTQEQKDDLFSKIDISKI